MSCTDAGAYVLGVLEDPERRAFEEHLRGCADCRREVADLAGIPSLLGRITADDLDDPPAPPETLLPRLLRGVRRERQRRRLVLAAVAAALVLVVGLGTAALVHRSDAPARSVAATSMSAVVVSNLHATAAVAPASGGSRITVDCRYDGAPPAGDYLLVVTDRSGAETRLATWKVGPDGRADVTASVHLRPAQIARLEVRLPDGRALLRLDRPA